MKPSVSSLTPLAVALALSGVPFSALQADTDSSDNQLSLKLRNYYQNRQIKDYSKYYFENGSTGSDLRRVQTQNKQQAWGQGFELNFESAWFGNTSAAVGLDASLYGGLKLVGKDSQYGTTVLKEDRPVFNERKGVYLSEQKNYGKLGQAYLKARTSFDELHLSGKAGWIPIEKPLLQTHYRLTPTRFQGAIAEANLGDLDLYGAWANKVSIHNHNKMSELTSLKPVKGGKGHELVPIDYMYTLGSSFNHDSGLGSELAYAESESYLKLYYANLNYTFQLNNQASLMVEGQYYKGKENGNKWTSGGTTYGNFDKDANLYNLNAKLTVDSLSLLASYSKVNAKKSGALGEFDYHLAYDAGHDYDTLDYATSRQISDFNHNGESVWQAGAEYAFDQHGLPGLSMGYTYTAGSNIEATDMPKYTGKYKENEHNVQLKYAFPQKELKGLNVTLMYARHNGDKELSEMKNQDKIGYHYESKTDLRVYVDYALAVF